MSEINPDNFYELRNRYYHCFYSSIDSIPSSVYIDKYTKENLIRVLKKIQDDGLKFKSEDTFDKIIQYISNELAYFSNKIMAACSQIMLEHSKIFPVKNNLLNQIGDIKPEVEEILNKREWFHYITPSSTENLKLLIAMPHYLIITDGFEKYFNVMDKELNGIGLNGHYDIVSVQDC